MRRGVCARRVTAATRGGLYNIHRIVYMYIYRTIISQSFGRMDERTDGP